MDKWLDKKTAVEWVKKDIWTMREGVLLVRGLNPSAENALDLFKEEILAEKQYAHAILEFGRYSIDPISFLNWARGTPSISLHQVFSNYLLKPEIFE